MEKRNDLVQNFDTAVDNAIKDAKGLDSQGYTKLDADMDASTAIGKTYQDAYDDVTATAAPCIYGFQCRCVYQGL